MSDLWLSEELVRAIVEHVRSDAPNEACGLLIGSHHQVHHVVAVQNVADTPQTRYVMDPAALSRYLPALADYGLELLGFYHSHPNGEPIPSQTDIRETNYFAAIQIIVGLKNDALRLSAWRIDMDRVFPISLHIGIQPDEPEEPSLSQAQKAAIIWSGLIAVALFIAIALYLLPPAPPIP